MNAWKTCLLLNWEKKSGGGNIWKSNSMNCNSNSQSNLIIKLIHDQIVWVCDSRNCECDSKVTSYLQSEWLHKLLLRLWQCNVVSQFNVIIWCIAFVKANIHLVIHQQSLDVSFCKCYPIFVTTLYYDTTLRCHYTHCQKVSIW